MDGFQILRVSSGEKNPFLFLAGGEAEGSFKTCQSTLFLTRPALRETSTSEPYLLTQKENTQLQPTYMYHVPPTGEKNHQHTCEEHSPKTRAYQNPDT